MGAGRLQSQVVARSDRTCRWKIKSKGAGVQTIVRALGMIDTAARMLVIVPGALEAADKAIDLDC